MFVEPEYICHEIHYDAIMRQLFTIHDQEAINVKNQSHKKCSVAD